MRTAVTDIQVQRGGVQAENAFTIKATSKAFDILSSGLYSDKIRAIVRELSCNAHDSHVAAGKADTPIEVKLPTRFDLEFYVKDYGLGLSDEDVMQLYTTYFESTKTNSDDYIGQLGLGSKSPFSYASTFIVESRFNGVKSAYTCFKNEMGMPAITKMGSGATDEANGVTVILSVKRDDVTKFTDAARKTFMYFNPQPKVLGDSFVPYSIKHTVAGNGWKIREADYYAHMRNAYVIQGFVAYPVDADQLAEHGLSISAYKLASTNLDLYVDIGKVEVAASREALSYDTRTIQNLIVVLEQATKEMHSTFQSEFDKCTTLWEVAQQFAKFADSGSREFREIFTSMCETTPFTWNGSPIKRTVDLDLSDIKNTTIRAMTISHKKVKSGGVWEPDGGKAVMSYDISHTNTYVVIDDEAKGHNITAEHVFDNYGGGSGRSPRVILIAPTAKKNYSQAEIDTIVKQLGSPSVLYARDLGIVRGRTAYAKRAPSQKLVWKGFPHLKGYYGGTSSKFSKLCWSTETIDLNAGGFYVAINKFTPMPIHTSSGAIENMIAHATALGILAEDAVVVGMPEADVKKIAGNSDWVELSTFVKQKYIEMNKDDQMFNQCVVHGIGMQFGSEVKDMFVNDWNLVRGDLVAGPFVDFFDSINDLKMKSSLVARSSIVPLANVFGIRTNVDDRVQALFDQWMKVLEHYGILSVINWTIVDKTNVDHVIKYINAMAVTKAVD